MIGQAITLAGFQFCITKIVHLVVDLPGLANGNIAHDSLVAIHFARSLAMDVDFTLDGTVHGTYDEYVRLATQECEAVPTPMERAAVTNRRGEQPGRGKLELDTRLPTPPQQWRRRRIPPPAQNDVEVDEVDSTRYISLDLGHRAQHTPATFHLGPPTSTAM